MQRAARATGGPSVCQCATVAHAHSLPLWNMRMALRAEAGCANGRHERWPPAARQGHEQHSTPSGMWRIACTAQHSTPGARRMWLWKQPNPCRGTRKGNSTHLRQARTQPALGQGAPACPRPAKSTCARVKGQGSARACAGHAAGSGSAWAQQ